MWRNTPGEISTRSCMVGTPRLSGLKSLHQTVNAAVREPPASIQQMDDGPECQVIKAVTVRGARYIHPDQVLVREPRKIAADVVGEALFCFVIGPVNKLRKPFHQSQHSKGCTAVHVVDLGREDV